MRPAAGALARILVLRAVCERLDVLDADAAELPALLDPYCPEPDDKLPLVMLAQFLTKVGVEIAFTPFTYRIVGFLKRAEREDYYDRNTDFSPFRLRA